MKSITSKKWWKAAGVRAIRTMAQAAAATIGTTTIISEVDWLLVGSATVLSGVFSMLTSLSGLPEAKEEA